MRRPLSREIVQGILLWECSCLVVVLTLAISGLTLLDYVWSRSNAKRCGAIRLGCRDLIPDGVIAIC